MYATAHVGRLEDLGVLRFRGPDAVSFLQGQLSQDVQRLATHGAAAHGTAAQDTILAGLHNPQGRTLALLRLAGQPDDITAVLPAELLALVIATLRRYVLRAKVTITAEQTLVPLGITGPESQLAALLADLGLPTAANATATRLGTEERWLLLAPAEHAGSIARRDDWQALDIAAGLPQVYLKTSGAFVGPMLNLDCVDAISYTKGCYTGQEVIARAHYRGRVKRRMQRFLSRTATSLAPGDVGGLSDGRAFRVVEAIAHADGRCEFLAVTALHAVAAATVTAVTAATSDDDVPAGVTLDCIPLPLPYTLPE